MKFQYTVVNILASLNLRVQSHIWASKTCLCVVFKLVKYHRFRFLSFTFIALEQSALRCMLSAFDIFWISLVGFSVCLISWFLYTHRHLFLTSKKIIAVYISALLSRSWLYFFQFIWLLRHLSEFAGDTVATIFWMLRELSCVRPPYGPHKPGCNSWPGSCSLSII